MSREVEEIKQRLDIVEIIQEYVPLKKSGVNFKAACPFHHEKTPSFMVSQTKQIWHCFGCHEGGDIFTFIEKIEGIEFFDVLKLLAERAGVKLLQQKPQEKKQKHLLQDILLVSANFFHKVLLEHEKAEFARNYFKERKISDFTVKEFLLGYAPDSWDALYKFLIGRGYQKSQIIQSGLAVYNQERNSTYDRFRNRVTIPLCDAYGNVVGFTARALGEDYQGGKYINTPQTEVYDKSSIVFGLSKAKQAIKEAGQVVIVEGNMDVISSHQAGIKNVVAVSGTAFTPIQVSMLKRFTNVFIFAFDADEAGQKAARKGIELALSEGIEVKVLTLLKGKDPDDCIKIDPHLWSDSIDQSLPVMDYIFHQAELKYDVSTAEGKKKYAAMVLGLLKFVGNPIERDHYIKKLSDNINVRMQILLEIIGKEKSMTRKETEHNKTKTEASDYISRQQRAVHDILALIMKYPPLIERNRDLEELLKDEKSQDLYKILKILYTNYIEKGKKPLDGNIFIQNIPNNGQNNEFVTYIQLYGDNHFADMEVSEINDAYQARYLFLKRLDLSKELNMVRQALQQAEQRHDQNAINSLSQRFLKITNQLSQLN